ncbi:MAG: Rpp14/Pop5 family protein [archaeon GB-1867-035]|nr:Rpp14/Pop5 family protein [Candidatus Culexmicrobium profundum]
MIKNHRNRYIIFEIHSPKPLNINKQKLLKTIFDTTLRLFGEVGSSSIFINLIEYNKTLQRGIIKCNHKSVLKLRAALALIHEIEAIPTLIHIVKITGTIRKAREILNSLPRTFILGDEEAVPVV